MLAPSLLTLPFSSASDRPRRSRVIRLAGCCQTMCSSLATSGISTRSNTHTQCQQRTHTRASSPQVLSKPSRLAVQLDAACWCHVRSMHLPVSRGESGQRSIRPKQSKQREVGSAMLIAQSAVGSSYSRPYNWMETEPEKQQWRTQVREHAVRIQVEVLQ